MEEETSDTSDQENRKAEDTVQLSLNGIPKEQLATVLEAVQRTLGKNESELDFSVQDILAKTNHQAEGVVEEGVQGNELLSSEKETFLNEMPIGVFVRVADADDFSRSSYSFFNRTVAKDMGLSEDPQALEEAEDLTDIFGSEALQQRNEKDREMQEHLADKPVGEKYTQKFEIIFTHPQTKEKRRLMIHRFAQKISDQEVKIHSYLVDHTEYHHLLEELQKANAVKDKFMGIVAHDLRSPFNSILGFHDLLSEEWEHLSEKEKKEYLFHARRAATQSYELLQQLLEWSRFQRGKIECKPEETSLQDLWEGVRQNTKQLAAKKFIRLSPQELPEDFSVFVDKNMISAVLRNLVTNAIKFTHHQGNVALSVEERDSEWEFCVADDGVGISEKNQKKLFQLDGKHSTEGTEKEKGTGMGLILCKEFVEAHGGKIWVESQEGYGSKFSFTIPQKKANETVDSATKGQ
ncbi:MAG: HAMP domain-containing histidine kinase [Candidatus Gracilibacteria bacterium]|nr:HAMP domain-containing histidine kinase [Candidatus Gracilibacteria bacterium]